MTTKLDPKGWTDSWDIPIESDERHFRLHLLVRPALPLVRDGDPTFGFVATVELEPLYSDVNDAPRVTIFRAEFDSFAMARDQAREAGERAELLRFHDEV